MPRFARMSPRSLRSPARAVPKSAATRSRRVKIARQAYAVFRDSNKKLLAVFRAKPGGDYAGSEGNCLEVVCYRYNAEGTRWAIQFFCGASQIGGNLVRSSTELTGMPAKLADHANGAHFEMIAYQDTTSQPSASTGAGNGTLFRGGE